MMMMTHNEHIDWNEDAKLTAYALGELEGDEAAAVEARLADDKDARQSVAAIRATANVLSEHFGQESTPGLTDAQRDAVLRGPEPSLRLVGGDDTPPARRWSTSMRRAWWATAGLAAAACIVLAVVVTISKSLSVLYRSTFIIR